MSQALPQPFDCNNVCVPSGSPSVVGPQGPSGPAGADGINGINAFTLSTTGTDVMPAEGGSVTVTTSSDTSFLAPGVVAYVQFWGYMQVTNLPTANTVTLQNLEDSGTGAYTDNAAPGTVLPAGAVIEAAGPQGPTGTTDTSLFLQKANNLNDVANTATSRSNLGLGTAAILDAGVTSGKLAPNDGNLTSNEIVVGTASGIQTRDAATVRALLGLTLGTSDTDIPPVDDASGLTNGDSVWATANGLETVDAATARGRLGITANGMLLYRHQQVSGDGGDFVTGGRATVPLNTEVVDTTGSGSISGSTILLAAGTYRYNFGVVACAVDHFQGYLYNTDDSAVIDNSDGSASYGQIAYAPSGSATTNVTATGQGRFTLATAKHIQLSANCETTKGGNGFGDDPLLGLGLVVYSWLELYKE